jgi:2-polyprenyl-3-methyl-5-hydroxy-6-metoxy-1,4-benzoquinol methylase
VSLRDRSVESPVVAGLKLKWREFRSPPRDGPIEFGIWTLDDPDTLLDQITQEEFDRNDERMPYFGAIWPAAESLVEKILASDRLERGARVLDLGCGLGACGFAAAQRGAHVVFMDWEPRALEIVEASALEQELPLSTFDFAVADWRAPPPRLGRFERILGADVLYEQRNAPAVAKFLADHLAPDGEAWISDPKRLHAASFTKLAQEAGLELLGADLLPPAPHHVEVALLRFRQRAR